MRFLLLFLAACAAHAPIPKAAEDLPALTSSAGETAKFFPAQQITVITFFSAHCPCQRAHDERLRTWFAHYAPLGVRFFVVDVEADSSLARDRDEAKSRGYTIWRDDNGTSADYFGAEYATYSVIVQGGRVVYKGGLDSDKQHMKPEAHLWLADALDDLLAGKQPRRAEAKAFGCELRRQ